ncbi:terminase large subunit, partial [Massilia sp. CCM 8695]|nr:terminase large subunit [Massilia frigida]
TIRLEHFEGEECWISLDLAEKSDIAALCLIFKRGNKFYVFFRFYLNEYEAEKKENDHYRRYALLDELHINPGNATDFDVIRTDIEAYAARFQVKELPYDPKFSSYFVAKLIEKGLPMVEISQTSTHFTMPIIEIENKVLTGDLVHQGNTCMEWMMGNVVLRESKFSGLKHPTKEKLSEKIDGPVAMLIGMGRALVFVDEYIDQGYVGL